ncbi:hypothetical protein [Gellertiella hungarica]|uniref:Uncharacterized protein n=1 Tax=Gellertiella hungarica TaxID=1572859 RepID=A0A7W6J4F9_9HYPH|nr:hypothetical protein [Gellertiella hungarica]MBB4064605.1 hypothetical protein [Gellertiella hungarica]
MHTRRFPVFAGLAAAITGIAALSVPAADAAQRDRAFFEQVAGSWKGPGEIVAGKYKGTKFSCNLIGEPGVDGKTGLKLDGTCRVGLFSQPMSAVLSEAGSSYKGKFLDGASGKGLDIISGRVNKDNVVLGINRSKLNGAMIARLEDDNSMNVTISVKVEDKMIPVIGMKLNRQLDDIKVGAIK